MSDLAGSRAESARVAPDRSFFTASLPAFGTPTDVWRFFQLSTTPELFGNPIHEHYPFAYDGF